MSTETLERCVCGEPATSGSSRNECGSCYRNRLLSIGNGFTPTRTDGHDPEKNRRWYNRLDRYKRTREEGSTPASTSTRAIDQARRISDETGRAFRADTKRGA